MDSVEPVREKVAWETPMNRERRGSQGSHSSSQHTILHGLEPTLKFDLYLSELQRL